ncbi:transposase [Sneathiella limimaris]|uniref:transposase n=1 Tax=Sneathiella limimaris TaxID=1964213 RepID=UPI00146EEAD6|nr:transposase [Sneathiella limimaris]
MSIDQFTHYAKAKVPGISSELSCTNTLAEFVGKYRHLVGLTVLSNMTGVSRHRLKSIENSVQSSQSFDEPRRLNPRIVRIDDLSATRTYEVEKGRKALKGHLVLSGEGYTEDAFQRGIRDTGFLNMVAGTTRADAVRLFRQTLDCDAVQYVTLDLSQTLISAAYQACPNAVVVADKFHVLNLVTAAFEKVAIDQRFKLRKERQSFHRARNYMKRPPKNLNDSEKREMVEWLVRFPDLHQAYELRRVFFELFEMDLSPQDARRALLRWLDFLPVKGPVGTAFRSVGRTVKKYLDLICAYFPCRLTNAPAEAYNRRIKEIVAVGGVRTLEDLIERARAEHSYEARLAFGRIPTKPPKRRQPLWDHVPVENSAIWVRPVKARDGELPLPSHRPTGLLEATDQLSALSIATLLWPEKFQ